jgi:hypothetical protein
VQVKLPDFVAVRFGLIAAVTMKIAVIDYIMLRSLVEVDLCSFLGAFPKKENSDN